ncbi:methyl-accepting chemotaxis sensory transducer with GAF sensor [Methanothermobacter sp. MT-2]|nr:methyl-accepting chemotaxis sensory transducer with GAF sensor [Methanothermobacter sp. MT-2]
MNLQSPPKRPTNPHTQKNIILFFKHLKLDTKLPLILLLEEKNPIILVGSYQEKKFNIGLTSKNLK